MMGRRRKCCCKDCNDILGLSVNLLSISAFEDERYEVEFKDEEVFICSTRAGVHDATMMLGIREGSLCRLLGHPMVSFKGSLELSSRGSLGFGSV